MEFTGDDAMALADKLADLDLSEGERAALDALIDAAGSDEVAGFAGNAGNAGKAGRYRPVIASIIGPNAGDLLQAPKTVFVTHDQDFEQTRKE